MGSGLVPMSAWKPVGIDGLEDSAFAAVRARDNTLVTAGPGAGKTELLGQRGVFLMQTGMCPYPRRVLAISFKRDAARNLRERFERRCSKELSRRLDSMTFDAFAKQLFDRFWRSLPPPFALKVPYRIAFTPPRNEIANFQRTVAGDLGNPNSATGRALALAGAPPVKPNSVMALSYDDVIKGIQSLSLSPFGVTSEASFVQLVRILWALDQNPIPLTFQMIGRLMQVIVDHNPAIKNAIRATYSHLFMDEFQDTTYVQYELMRSIFGGSDTIVTAVGDDKQKIMGWAGAQNDSFGEFTADFLLGGPALGRSHETLKFNYRSNARIVEILNILKARLAPAEPDFQAVRPAPAIPNEQICCIVVSADQVAEDRDIAAYVENEIKQGMPPREIGLLVRQKATDWESRLAPQFANNGIGLRNEDRDVGGASIQDLMTEPYAQTISDAVEFLTLKRGGVVWARLVDELLTIEGLDEDDAAKVARVLDPLDQFKKANGIGDASAVANKVKMEQLIDTAEAFFGLGRLASMAPHYQQGDYFQQIRRATKAFLLESADGSRSWKGALAWYRGENQVPLLTITKSKGLEYTMVVLPGLDDTQWWSFAGNPTEGHSNFFVAASRAKERLFLAFCRANQAKKIGEIYKLLDDAQVPAQTSEDWVKSRQ
ncbi:UvrD-helicase domain-containing protein [Mesorhizobium sp. BHbdii]